MDTQNLRAVPVALLSALLLVGCGSTADIVRPSDYVGEMTSARLEDLYLVTTDGKRLKFREVFKDVEPQTGFMTTPLPFRRIDIAQVVFDTVAPVMDYYDANANNNGYLEGPELLVLYVREGAIGLGYSVDYVSLNPRIKALATSTGETGGLVKFVEKNKASMTDRAHQIFREIEQVGLERRVRGSGSSSGGGGR